MISFYKFGILSWFSWSFFDFSLPKSGIIEIIAKQLDQVTGSILQKLNLLLERLELLEKQVELLEKQVDNLKFYKLLAYIVSTVFIFLIALLFWKYAASNTEILHNLANTHHDVLFIKKNTAVINNDLINMQSTIDVVNDTTQQTSREVNKMFFEDFIPKYARQVARLNRTPIKIPFVLCPETHPSIKSRLYEIVKSDDKWEWVYKK
jgi:hypothetical protein